MHDDIREFFELWEITYPELTKYTGWLMAKKNAKTDREIKNWLTPDMDKFRVVAPGMIDSLDLMLGELSEEKRKKWEESLLRYYNMLRKGFINIIVDFMDCGRKITKSFFIPINILEKCSFNEDGGIDGMDYIDLYLRGVYEIYCIDWNVDHNDPRSKV